VERIAEKIRERNEEPAHEGRPEANVQHGSHSLYDFCFTMKPGDLVINKEGTTDYTDGREKQIDESEVALLFLICVIRVIRGWSLLAG